MTPAELRQLRERATPGPWRDDASGMFPVVMGSQARPNVPLICELAKFGGYEDECPANAALIALAPDLAELLADAWALLDKPFLLDHEHGHWRTCAYPKAKVDAVLEKLASLGVPDA